MPDRGRLGAAAISLSLLVGGVAACSDDEPDRTATDVCAQLDPSAGLADLASGFDPTDVPRALVRLDSMEVQLEQLRDAAPDEVREPLDVELTYVRALRDALQEVDPDDAAAVADAVNNLDAEAAAANVAAGDLQRFQEANCNTPPPTG